MFYAHVRRWCCHVLPWHRLLTYLAGTCLILHTRADGRWRGPIENTPNNRLHIEVLMRTCCLFMTQVRYHRDDDRRCRRRRRQAPVSSQ